MEEKRLTENFFNLQLLLKKSNDFIRNLFVDSYKIKTNKEWIENGKSAELFFETKNGKAAFNVMTNTQKKYALHGDTSKWDISLMYLIFSNTKLLEKSKLKHLEKIREIRNKVAHNSNMSLNNEEFQTCLSQLKQCLMNLGMNKIEIEQFFSNLEVNNKEFKQSNDSDQVLSLKNKADQCITQNNFSQSIEFYSKAIKLEMSDDLKSKIHSNRSFAYLKLFEKTSRQNKDFLFKALIDAEQSVNFNPKWFKSYARVAQVYVEFNEIEKAIENFTKALVLDPYNEEIKTLLANTRYQNFEQNRYSHFDVNRQPKTTEERSEEFIQKLQPRFGTNDCEQLIDNIKQAAIELDKSLKDVFLAHEYRDGSTKCTQDYEKAAKLYSKAAKCGNIEAMYNLAQLTMHGKGVKQNYQMALSLLRNAASQPAFKKFGKFSNEIPVVGVAESQHFLGIIYQEGIYVTKNMALAIDYYQKAVDNGFPQSANNLGILYLKGDGVKVDLDRAENLFLFCHKKGCLDSIANLVDLYLVKGDSTNALLWHQRALENNSLFDLSRNELILKEINDLNKMKKLANVPADKSIDSYLKDNMPQLFKLKSNYLFKPYPNGNKSRTYDPEMLAEHANKGSAFAQRMLHALFIFSGALCEYVEITNLDDFQFKSIVERMSQAYQIESLVCQIPIELHDNLINRLEKILALNLQDRVNFNASICYIHLIMGNYEQTIMFIDEALKKYPDCSHMHLVRGSMFCFLENFEQGLKEFEYLIKMQPENFELYYFKATALKYLAKFDEAFKNYEIFVQNSEKDARKLPEAYYSMELIQQFMLSKNKMVLEYFNKGKQAERDQLPCFLPYESSSKDMLSNFVDLTKNKINNVPEFNFRNDNYRNELIKEHRKSFLDFQNFNLSSKFIIQTTLVPLKVQKALSVLENLKEISLKQIDFTKDEILDKFYINLRVFDYPFFGLTSVFFLVDDQNGMMERLSVYNLGKDYDKISQDFRIGTWIAIVNPYIRHAADGKPMIRVDDVNSIIFTGKYTNKMCQYCGKADSKFNCSKCMKAFYCSKKCQVDDWKQLNHKFVCS